MNVSSTSSYIALQLQGGQLPEARTRAPDAAPVPPAPLPPRDAVAGREAMPRAEAAERARPAQGVAVPETAETERVQAAFAREAPLAGQRPQILPPGSLLDIKV